MTRCRGWRSIWTSRTSERLSLRLRAVLKTLPLSPGIRVLEVGCGPGALARTLASVMGEGHVLGIDRSERAIAQAIAGW
jgi:cyclopropane fatty-acyl-phospholipid synthase-like methyltransferase